MVEFEGNVLPRDQITLWRDKKWDGKVHGSVFMLTCGVTFFLIRLK